jgi:hypothetical protein
MQAKTRDVNINQTGGEFKNKLGVNATAQIQADGSVNFNSFPATTLDKDQWYTGIFDEPWSYAGKLGKVFMFFGMSLIVSSASRAVPGDNVNYFRLIWGLGSGTSAVLLSKNKDKRKSKFGYAIAASTALGIFKGL